MSKVITVEQADHHRNGTGGNGFYVGIIREAKPGHPETRKLVIYFPQIGDCAIAVLDLAQAAEGNIYMYPHAEQPGGNAWRGGEYRPVAEAIRETVEARWDHARSMM